MAGMQAQQPQSREPSAASWRTPTIMLMVMSAGMFLCFSTWQALLNNFAIERAAFTGAEIGMLQSIREIPGFLAFTVIGLLFLMREQVLALLSLLVMGAGVAVTGYFPSVLGLYVTTIAMSVGFHYYETLAQSLSLQWLLKAEAPRQMGRIIAAGSAATVAAYGAIFLAWKLLDLDYTTIYLAGGLLTVAAAAILLVAFPQFRDGVPQRKKLFLRRRYWLFYALTFMWGARRQIFIVFAGFMMVERFGYTVPQITGLFLATAVFNMIFAGRIGGLVGKWGERRALTFEYLGLIGVFTMYAFVQDPWVAAALYLIDHGFFALSIGVKTYFQKIADPTDIAPTSGVAFTINHIAAVFIPAAFGLIWLTSPAAVFLLGAAMAAVSLFLARLIPRDPEAGNEVIWSRAAPAVVSAAE
jgi:hypothetical protein